MLHADRIVRGIERFFPDLQPVFEIALASLAEKQQKIADAAQLVDNQKLRIDAANGNFASIANTVQTLGDLQTHLAEQRRKWDEFQTLGNMTDEADAAWRTQNPEEARRYTNFSRGVPPHIHAQHLQDAQDELGPAEGGKDTAAAEKSRDIRERTALKNRQWDRDHPDATPEEQRQAHFDNRLAVTREVTQATSARLASGGGTYAERRLEAFREWYRDDYGKDPSFQEEEQFLRWERLRGGGLTAAQQQQNNQIMEARRQIGELPENVQSVLDRTLAGETVRDREMQGWSGTQKRLVKALGKQSMDRTAADQEIVKTYELAQKPLLEPGQTEMPSAGGAAVTPGAATGGVAPRGTPGAAAPPAGAAAPAPPSRQAPDPAKYRQALAAGFPREQVKQGYIDDGGTADQFELLFPSAAPQRGSSALAPQSDFPVPAFGM
ncbi:MAG: hypothetical protein J2P48_01245 [Alphaproteobacteria bacterium]|nr:hypothetical protein [Alphaproteobacteria bacterium]